MSRCCAEPTCNQALPQGRYRRFCPGRECKRKFDMRVAGRAYRLYAVAMRWRGFPRSHAKGARNPHNPYLGEVTVMLDQFLRDDRAMRETALARQASPDYAALSREHIERYPIIRAELAKR